MNRRPRHKHLFSVLIFILFAAAFAPAQTQPSTPTPREQIDEIVRQTLSATGVPSASIAIVQGAATTYLQAYGDARIEPHTPALPAMRYSVGSISKQFTAAAVLLLAEQGKLSLDDRVSGFVPNLTRGGEITIRELLSHTSGYQDYWPQDYVPPMMLKPISAEQIMDMWARKPLDFPPGTKWQYSNTNYVIAGVIVEKVSGMPLLQFLSQRVFTPLGMKSVADTNLNKLPPTDPTGYFRYALGPLHPAPKEGRGWMFAAALAASWDHQSASRQQLPERKREYRGPAAPCRFPGPRAVDAQQQDNR